MSKSPAFLNCGVPTEPEDQKLCPVCDRVPFHRERHRSRSNPRVCEACKYWFRYHRKEINKLLQRCSCSRRCNVSFINRVTCNFCRLKKCISVGMTIRPFIPTHAFHQDKTLIYYQKEADAIEQAFKETCFTYENIENLIKTAETPEVQCASSIFCPIKQNINIPIKVKFEDFIEKYAGANGVIKFAKRISGFEELSRLDRDYLIQTRLFPVLFLRFARLFDSRDSVIYCLNGQVIRKDDIPLDGNAKYVHKMFEIAEKINNLNLTEGEIAVFSSVLMLTGLTLELNDTSSVMRLHDPLCEMLYLLLSENHPEHPYLYEEIFEILPKLIELDILHETYSKFHNLTSVKISSGTETREIIMVSISRSDDNKNKRVLETLTKASEPKRNCAMGESPTSSPTKSFYLEPFSLDLPINTSRGSSRKNPLRKTLFYSTFSKRYYTNVEPVKSNRIPSSTYTRQQIPDSPIVLQQADDFSVDDAFKCPEPFVENIDNCMQSILYPIPHSSTSEVWDSDNLLQNSSISDSDSNVSENPESDVPTHPSLDSNLDGFEPDNPTQS